MNESLDIPAPELLAVSGASFPLVRAGSGEPILFVHGAWADHRIWSPVWRQVAARHSFLTYTQRHFGTWDWPLDRPFSRDVHAADLVEILMAMDERVHLAGWSYAGAPLLRAALDVPELVGSIVMYEPSMPELLRGSDAGRSVYEEFWNGLMPVYAIAKQGNLDQAMRRGLEFVFGLPQGRFCDLDRSAQRVFLDNTHTMLPDLVAAAPTPLTATELGKVSQPVLLITGETTRDIYSIETQMLLTVLPNASFVEMSAIGHGGPVQNPSEFAARVLEFVDSRSN